ncbi:hypothetical protein FQN60_005018 [Etheostoma spectabile]|nr:hypothetical protein FQN60_005018 [Etheostoma spectabile]
MSGVVRGPAGNNDCRIYVGNLPPDIRTKDVEDVFYKYGTIRDIDLKNRRGGPPFAFIEFEDPRDADDAVYGRDGYDYDGYRLRVEFPRSGRGSRGGFGGIGGAPRGRYGPPSRRSEYRVIVSGLPQSGSWQDLKDHMREAGDVCYADVFRDGTGVVEFVRKEDMTYAVRKLDNTKFRSHEVWRDCLHSCEIRRSPQPKLWKITLPQPWQSEQEPQSQRQPQSQQFPGPWQRIAPLLASSQPLSIPFLNLSTTDVLSIITTCGVNFQCCERVFSSSSSGRQASSSSPSSLTMTDRKAVIKNADMSEDMQQDAVDCATQAMEKYNIEKDIAAYIKKEFDKKYNPTWHCIVGRNFGSYVTHETKHFIYFYLGQVAILLFKSG